MNHVWTINSYIEKEILVLDILSYFILLLPNLISITIELPLTLNLDYTNAKFIGYSQHAGCVLVCTLLNLALTSI